MVAPHSEEHIGITRLCRDVDLLADIGFRSYYVEQWIWEILRVRGRESESNGRCCIRHQIKQISEPGARTMPQLIHFFEPSRVGVHRPRLKVCIVIAIHVLAQKSDFSDALLSQHFDFVND